MVGKKKKEQKERNLQQEREWVFRVELILGLGGDQHLTDEDREALSFFERYPDSTIEEERKGVSRKIKGAGSFGNIIKKAKAIHAGARKVLDEKRKGDKDLLENVENAPSGIEFMIARFEDLIIEAQNWRRKFDEEGLRIVEKRGSSKGSDEVRIKKRQLCADLIEKAKSAIKVLRNKRLDVYRNTEDVALLEQIKETEARSLADQFGVKVVDKGGTSDVKLIMGRTGATAYAFKSMQGESDQTGMPPGSAMLREAVSSLVSKTIAKLAGFDFGCAEVTLASINGEPGALVEGIQGTFVNTETPPELADDDDDISYGKKMSAWKEKATNTIRRVRKEDAQRLLLGNIALGQFDMKWDNMAVEDDGTARPFDNGAAFPSESVVQKFLHGFNSQGAAAVGANFFCLPGVLGGAELDFADDPLPGEMVRGFLAIDVNAIRQTAQTERTRLCQQQNLDPNLLADDSIEVAIKSIEAAQIVLNNDPNVSMRDFTTQYTIELKKLIPNSGD